MSEITDKDRLDFLQMLNDKAEYTGRVVCRPSQTGRGWRLHETSRPGASTDVREAIDWYMEHYEKAQRRQEDEN